MAEWNRSDRDTYSECGSFFLAVNASDRQCGARSRGAHGTLTIRARLSTFLVSFVTILACSFFVSTFLFNLLHYFILTTYMISADTVGRKCRCKLIGLEQVTSIFKSNVVIERSLIISSMSKPHPTTLVALGQLYTNAPSRSWLKSTTTLSDFIVKYFL